MTDKGTQGPLGSATSISRRRFLKESALASAVVAIPYLADKSVAFGKESKTSSAKAAKGADAKLDRALEKLVAMEGGPPGVIAIVQRGEHLSVHRFGVANVKSGRPMRIDDHMRIASAAKAFSGAVALSLVSKVSPGPSSCPFTLIHEVRGTGILRSSYSRCRMGTRDSRA